MEGLQVSEAGLIVYIHPYKSNQVSKAVTRELSSLLFTYNEIFDGVVLAYEIKSLDKCARILPGVCPYFGVNLKVLEFANKGKVEKLTHDSIHVVVLGFSAAIIAEKDIRAEFGYRMKHEKGVYASKSHKRHVIKKDTMIRFMVKSFDEETLQVYGSLVPDNTGSICWLDKNLEVVPQSDRSTKKRENERQPLLSDKDALDGEPSTVDTVQKLKKSKKQKVREES
ncbi:hypothetical protein TSUD_181270 [Trifolium subterraneum]|uniref:DNA-directed RNA polymerase subunit n=1 Tax=Trifolium subterraneum TaxID=3900 RepID=A0A2Z6M012_TRISU|nr:hypothetical protein TSUD_181270 [Trifolium subterraneum]